MCSAETAIHIYCRHPTRMLDVRTNYRNRYTQTDVKCPFKCNSEDSQEHLLECDKLETNQLSENLPKYEELFSSQISQQINVGKILEGRFKIRKKLLSRKADESPTCLVSVKS